MKEAENRYLVVIAGPTAVGKTALAIQLAKYYNTVIISADSRQFYKELSIGTAKPDEQQLKDVTHYFVNNKSIPDLYGAGHFEKDVIPLLNELFKQHSIIFMVGGSGLYIDAVLNGVDDFIDIPISVRENINLSLKEKGINWLQEEVRKNDPDYFNSVDIYNSQRLVRALEVFSYTGLPYSSFLKKEKADRNFTPVKILVNMPRQELYHRINERVDKMMEEGLLEEAKKFSDQKNVNALKTVGYKELYDYLDGLYDLKTAVDKIKQHTRNYAKRQLTWFKNKDAFTEFEPENMTAIKSYIDSVILKQSGGSVPGS